MEYWEFLLQQEGDSNWLPLDTSQMEILEGRYRIMAHCSQAQTPVQIHISQLLNEQVPPKRRSLKRRGQTNENGLMVVLPFTRLTAGTWDIYCQATVTDPEAGEAEPEPAAVAADTSEPWRYAIQLRVLSQDGGADGDWFADDGSAAALRPREDSTELAAQADVATDRPPTTPTATTWANRDLQQVAEIIDQAQASLVDAGNGSESLYSLALSQTAFMASQELPIQLTGHASSVVEGESCSDMALMVRLSDPQTAEVLSLVPFSLTASSLPSDFAIHLALPEGLATRLLLGELALVSWQAGAANLLALQRFTVTVDLAALFDEIANRAEDDTDLDLVFAPDKLSGASDQKVATTQKQDEDRESPARVEFPVAPPRSVPSITLPRSRPTIPPKIYYPSPHEASARQPALPPLGQPKPVSKTNPDSTPEGFPTEADSVAPGADAAAAPETSTAEAAAAHSPAAVSPANPTQPAPARGLNLPPLKPAAANRADTAEHGGNPGRSAIASDADETTESPQKAEPLMLPSHETVAFQALNLQERFWTRLNDLAVIIQEEAQQARQEDFEIQSAALEEGEVEPLPFIPFEGEVVIYEDLESSAAELTPEAATALIDRLQNQEEAEPITPPVPEIEVPATELTAGETVLLTLRVPYHLNRLYLKVWITDPQTRSLTDEPRQITHLAPNGRGQLEGAIQLTVPMGCLEVWLEAISVDMVTQQESYKASVSCSVNPPGNDSSSRLDEFEL